jgi:hypothetical protein
MRNVAVCFVSMIRSLGRFVGALTLVAVLGISAFGQSVENGSIVGTVKDSKGGVIQGATVTVTDLSQGVTKTALTSSDGDFAFPEIPPGDYTVAVDLPGFKTAVKTGVHLPVDTKVNVGDVVLDVGSISETVTVQASAGQLALQSVSGERSAVITNLQLRDLALNGQNTMDLMKMIPGVIASGSASNTGQSTVLNIVGIVNINGTRSLQNNYTVDGMVNLNLGNNTGALVTVNPDAMAEVKVETSNYAAEYGRSGGGTIALTTRSGTDDYHGGLLYFRRNQAMNADSVFNDDDNAVISPTPYDLHTTPLYDYNYYGWNLGGPIFIPHLVHGKEHKLYFFVSQEFYRQLIPQTSQQNIEVPTALERTGDFVGAVDGKGNPIVIIDPHTGTQADGMLNGVPTLNVIPSSEIYQPGQSALNFLPLPNSAGAAGGNVYNYQTEIPSAYPRSETILRGDWQANDNTRLSISWIHNTDDEEFAYGTSTESWNWPLATGARKNGPGNVETITLTHNFGPTWVNEFTFGSARGAVQIAPTTDAATRAATGVDTPFLFPNADVSNLIPSFTFGGIASVSSTPSTSVTGLFYQKFNIWQIMDNLTKVHGAHIFKFGVYISSDSNASSSQSNTESSIDFTNNASNPLNSGNPFSNALFGVYNQYSQVSAQVLQDYIYHEVSWYAEDTWKVKSNLTLDLGVRFSWLQPYYDKGYDVGYFNPSLYVASEAPQLYYPVCIGDGTTGFTGTCTSASATYRALPSSAPPTAAQMAAATSANTQPGYDVGREVPGTGSLTNGLVTLPGQLGYPVSGINTPAIVYQPRLGFAWDAGGRHTTVVRGGFGTSPDRYESESCGATDSPITTTPTLNFGYLQNITPGSGALAPAAVCGFGENEKFPLVTSYSVGVQKDLGHGTVIDIAYVGDFSRHLLREQDLNSVPYGTAFNAPAQDPTQYPGGVIPANEAAAGPGYSLYPEYVAAGANFMGDKVLSTDFLRPYKGYDTIQYYTFDANANFNSLQVSFKRQFTKTIVFTAAYTLSRALTTTSSDGTYTNYLSASRFDYGLASFDRRNVFVGSFVWYMPGIARFMGNGGFARTVFNNWILSGAPWIASGTPTQLGLTISGVDAGERLLGTPTSCSNCGGQAPMFFLSGKPQYGTANNSFNLSAFVVPQIGQIGPYPQAYMRNPGIYNQDLSIFKNITFNESGSRYVQLRFEAFNIFNHPQYTGFNGTTNVTNALGQTGSAIFANFTGLTAANNLRGTNVSNPLGNYFGEYNGAQNQRVLQVAAKFYF